MPELEVGVPAQGSPPGTCDLTSLTGAVLLGGVEGAWTVRIDRDRHWAARVWPPGVGIESRPVVRPIEVTARPAVNEEEDLIGAMIWAAQQAHRDLAGGPSAEPETHRVGYEVDDSMRCQERGPAGSPCGQRVGHDGPHSWEPRIPQPGDPLEMCGALRVTAGRDDHCTTWKGHPGPHSWETQ